MKYYIDNDKDIWVFTEGYTEARILYYYEATNTYRNHDTFDSYDEEQFEGMKATHKLVEITEEEYVLEMI